MCQRVFRFTVREDGLIQGMMFRSAFDNKKIKPNRVYEVSEVLGEMVITDIGNMDKEMAKDFNLMDISQFINVYGRYRILNDKEMEHEYKCDMNNGQL